MAVWVLTLWNKRELIGDAVRSLWDQATRRRVVHVCEQDVGQYAGQGYPPGVFYNAIVANIPPEDYIAWLSDDDVLLPDYVEALAGYLDEHPEANACYGQLERWALAEDGRTWKLGDLPGGPIYGIQGMPCCNIDGGQVMYRGQVLDRIDPPWHPMTMQACHVSDGLLLNKIAAVTPIYPVGKLVMRNRITWLSSHWRLVGDSPQFTH
jgi:hypothetical protein